MSIPPFDRAYWVIPNRLLAGAIPASPHPNEAREKLNALAETPIHAVINLMEAHEVNHEGTPFFDYAPVLHERGVVVLRFPIRDVSIPTKAEMTVLLDTIDALHAEGKSVYVHCWGGIGRTGTVVGCYLIRHGLATPDNALEHIATLKQDSTLAHRTSPETPEQRTFVEEWGN